MSNNYKPHLIVFPEDDANRQIAVGFLNNQNLNDRNISLLKAAGGWKRVIDIFLEDHVSKMQRFSERRFVLLIDFDRDPNRLNYVRERIPKDSKDRVFIIGVFSEPEELRNDIKMSFEKIGETLASECYQNTNKIWNHRLLEHNRNELKQIISSVKPFLFNN